MVSFSLVWLLILINLAVLDVKDKSHIQRIVRNILKQHSADITGGFLKKIEKISFRGDGLE